ncbi:MAG: hypothetical protein JW811_10350 [Clostridiales bacterium]|nr:hypothetical protein [Clostridiales bacterium]
MKKHTGKLIAPIVITALILLYFVGLIIIALTTSWLPAWALIAGVVLPLCVMGVMVYVLIERIKEIRSGEEDDLSQY